MVKNNVQNINKKRLRLFMREEFARLPQKVKLLYSGI